MRLQQNSPMSEFFDKNQVYKIHCAKELDLFISATTLDYPILHSLGGIEAFLE